MSIIVALRWNFPVGALLVDARPGGGANLNKEMFSLGGPTACD